MRDMKKKLIIMVIVLGLVDVVIPVPILCILVLYGLLARPAWFLRIAREVCKAESEAQAGHP
jgi:hypothetical protein